MPATTQLGEASINSMCLRPINPAPATPIRFTALTPQSPSSGRVGARHLPKLPASLGFSVMIYDLSSFFALLGSA
jgi:hypothetical protein